MKRWSILLLALSLPCTAAMASGSDVLESAVRKRLGRLQTQNSEIKRSWAIEGFIPVKNVEFSYKESDGLRVDTDDLDAFDRSSIDRSFKINIKSFKEMSTFWQSRQISASLVQATDLELSSQNRFDVYMSIVQQALYYKMVSLFGAREKDLNKSVEQTSLLLGLPKANVKDLINELQRLNKVSSEGSGYKSQSVATNDIDVKEYAALVEALVQNVSALSKTFGRKIVNDEPLSLRKKRLELNLKKINREVSWADDKKIIDSVELSEGSESSTSLNSSRATSDKSIQINFNIPIRFDGENYARESVLQNIEEQDLQRDILKSKGEMERKRFEIQGLGAQAESTLERLSKTRDMMKKVKKVKDVEFRRMLGEMLFDLERDVLVLTLKFYTEYLAYMQDGGYLASGDINVLDPKWLQ